MKLVGLRNYFTFIFTRAAYVPERPVTTLKGLFCHIDSLFRTMLFLVSSVNHPEIDFRRIIKHTAIIHVFEFINFSTASKPYATLSVESYAVDPSLRGEIIEIANGQTVLLRQIYSF